MTQWLTGRAYERPAGAKEPQAKKPIAAATSSCLTVENRDSEVTDSESLLPGEFYNFPAESHKTAQLGPWGDIFAHQGRRPALREGEVE